MPCGTARGVDDGEFEGVNAHYITAPEFADLCARFDKVLMF